MRQPGAVGEMQHLAGVILHASVPFIPLGRLRQFYHACTRAVNMLFNEAQFTSLPLEELRIVGQI